MVPVACSGNGETIKRLHIAINGIVQGVGFRPFVYRLARAAQLCGWVRNTTAGVEIEIQGPAEKVAAFEADLADHSPPLAAISSIASKPVPTVAGNDVFTILPSKKGDRHIQVAPDAALCSDCLRELLDPTDRRYRYPFITCTNCGPRYSIITTLPYDRPGTTMSAFQLCEECQKEYNDPDNRRFHAQPLACPACGPQIRLLKGDGHLLAEKDEAISETVKLLAEGCILAIKGIGGYHLVVDACNHDAVKRLRERKKRDEKPFAVMIASLEAARGVAQLSSQEERLLEGTESPIVIARRQESCPVSRLVAPGNNLLGLMLPYTPIHHLLFAPSPVFSHPLPDGEGEINPLALRERDRERAPVFQALVMTSANLSNEPITFEDDKALDQLRGIADFFLTHNRAIHTPGDDSVMRVFQHTPLFYRRSRGFAPRGVRLPFSVAPILAVGAELKNTVCLAQGERAFLSQHIGDLQNSATYDSFSRTIAHLSNIMDITPELVVRDQHPDYLSSIHADQTGLRVMAVQHHHAHMAACMAENGLEGEVIGVILDGTGYGSDGTIWGGEFLLGGYGSFRRAGHFRPVRLPGGDSATREPWRMALSYLHQALGPMAWDLDYPGRTSITGRDRELLACMMEKGINSPFTSSCGRLFDAVASLLDIRQYVSYDGQAAVELEAVAETAGDIGGTFAYNLSTSADSFTDNSTTENCIESGLVLDFAPLFTEIVAARASAVPIPDIARRFHATVASAVEETCGRIAGDSGVSRVVLSGGVFQNRLLSEMIYTRLTERGLQVFTHRLVPPNDGGIALGQTAIAGWRNN